MTDTKPAKAEVHGHRITWFCRVCDQPIGPYTGYLAIDIYAVNEVERDARNRESAEPRAYTAGEFLDFPHPVRWQALHAGCDPDPDGDEYAIDIDRIGTLSRLIHWAGYPRKPGFGTRTGTRSCWRLARTHSSQVTVCHGSGGG